MNESNITAAKSIIGEKVKNTEGQDLGTVKELLLDTASGKIEYGVVTYGGLLGIGSKDIAVPYEAFITDKDQDFFTLNVDKDIIEKTTSQIEYDGKTYFIY